MLHLRGGEGQVNLSLAGSELFVVQASVMGCQNGWPKPSLYAFPFWLMSDDGGDSRWTVECEVPTDCRTIVENVYRVGFDLKGGQQSHRGIGEVIESISELSEN